MIAIKVNDHFVIHQLGNTPRCLPVDTQSYIRLLVFIKIVVNSNVSPALQTILYKFFNRWQFNFCDLRHILTQLQSILAEISIEIFRLVIFPFEFLVLHAVFSKFNRTNLGLRCYYKGKTNNRADNFLHTIWMFRIILIVLSLSTVALAKVDSLFFMLPATATPFSSRCVALFRFT